MKYNFLLKHWYFEIRTVACVCVLGGVGGVQSITLKTSWDSSSCLFVFTLWYMVISFTEDHRCFGSEQDLAMLTKIVTIQFKSVTCMYYTCINYSSWKDVHGGVDNSVLFNAVKYILYTYIHTLL